MINYITQNICCQNISWRAVNDVRPSKTIYSPYISISIKRNTWGLMRHRNNDKNILHKYRKKNIQKYTAYMRSWASASESVSFSSGDFNKETTLKYFNWMFNMTAIWIILPPTSFYYCCHMAWCVWCAELNWAVHDLLNTAIWGIYVLR